MSATPEQLEKTAVEPEPEDHSRTQTSDLETHPTDVVTQRSEEELVLEDLLVEDVSIDGMCGVY